MDYRIKPVKLPGRPMVYYLYVDGACIAQDTDLASLCNVICCMEDSTAALEKYGLRLGIVG